MKSAIIRLALAAAVAVCVHDASVAQLSLPVPRQDPLSEVGNDPVLAIEQGGSPENDQAFLDLVRMAAARHPLMAKARADEQVADATRRIVRSELLPKFEFGINADHTLQRRFGNNVSTIVERSRLDGRTDLSASATQTLFDFGATARSIQGARAKQWAIVWQTHDQLARLALRATDAYYDLLAAQQLGGLSRSYLDRQRSLRDAVAERIVRGASARGDLARVDAMLARASSQGSRFERQLAEASARFSEITGMPAPAVVVRPSFIGPVIADRDQAVQGSEGAPAVIAIRREAEAARHDARAARSAALPKVTGGVEAGRYGVLEGLPDYDVRARFTVRMGLNGGTDARIDRASAEALSAEARAAVAREEAERDASIAFSDLEALNAQLIAQRSNYIAARQVRDVTAERFRLERGTPDDMLDAEETLFGVAANYVQAVAERDAARFMLLYRAGKLIDALALKTESETR